MSDVSDDFHEHCNYTDIYQLLRQYSTDTGIMPADVLAPGQISAHLLTKLVKS